MGLSNLIGALKCVGPRVDKTIARHRLAVCQVCPSLTAQARCTHCRCYMPVKVTCSQERTLTGVVEVRCPEGRWA